MMSDDVLRAMLKPSPNPQTIKLDQRFQRYFYEVAFAGEHQGMTLEFGLAPANTMLDESHLVLETDYGYCALDNHCTFFQSLLGMPFATLNRDELGKKLALVLPWAPQEFTDLFGRVTPNVYAKLSHSQYVLRLRLMAADCSVSFNMAAAEEFWQQLLDHPSVSEKTAINSSKKEIRPEVDVTLGKVKIGRKVLSDLKVGDVVSLDNCVFDTSGQGSINLGEDTLLVQWQSRGITDNFLVTGREASYAN